MTAFEEGIIALQQEIELAQANRREIGPRYVVTTYAETRPNCFEPHTEMGFDDLGEAMAACGPDDTLWDRVTQDYLKR